MTPGKGVISGWESRRRLQRSLLLLQGCVPSTTPLPLAFPHREFTKFSESTETLTKAEAEEPEGPWAPQPGKNAARQSETKEWGRWQRKSRQSDGTVSFLKYSLFCLELNKSAVLTQPSTLVLWAHRLGALWEMDSFRIFFRQTSPPTVVETYEGLTVAFQTQTRKTRLSKQSDLSPSTFTIWP